MKRLSYKKVFSQYSLSSLDCLSHFSYLLYKRVRIALSPFFPLAEREKWYFADHRFTGLASDDMPMGFNYSTGDTEEGFLNLEYIDFYDYLPKEDLSAFKKSLKKFTLKNKPSSFGIFLTDKDEERIDRMGRYIDWQAFSSLIVVKLTRNKYLAQFSPHVDISLRNLSSSFLMVRYRFCIGEDFNKKLNAICKSQYLPYTNIVRRFDAHWYTPKKFGWSSYTGNNAREKEVYSLLSSLKWNSFVELKRYFMIHFEHNQLFPPTFETYSTNVRPNNSKESRCFWNSIMLEDYIDYAPKYNACVCWKSKSNQYEGATLSAYCGGPYYNSDFSSEYAELYISDVYGVYMTASSIREIAERDIAISNKKISKAIRKAKTSLVLKVRVKVERILYYSYRFISEFSGDTIDYDDIKEFKTRSHQNFSFTANALKDISKSTAETKKQIDTLLNILNNVAEYGSSKSNMRLQYLMIFVTIMSLITAVIAILENDPYILNSLRDIIRIL